MSIRLLAAACFLLGAAPAIAQSTLPVPSGFYPIEGTEQPFYIKKDSIRENVMDREATTVALVMTFVSDAQGNRGYAVGNYIGRDRTEPAAMNRLAVYCGSASPEDPRYIQLAYDVGKGLAARGIGVVYGGGRLGLMGATARGALEAGGEVIGVIPDALANSEVANHDCTELYTVGGMHERKQRFTDLSDGFVTIPGGVGTMDELWEAMSWAQLGYHDNPVGLLNAFGFYDELIAFNRKLAEVGFVRPVHQGILVHDTTLDGLLDKMASYEPHTPIFQMKADDL